MAICYEYWDWAVYPEDTLPPITKSIKDAVLHAIKEKHTYTTAIVQAHLERIINAVMLDSRGVVYDTELSIIMSWIIGSTPSPFASVELTKILLAIMKKNDSPPFALSPTHIYSNLTPPIVHHILNLARGGVLDVHEVIYPEEVQWGEVLAQGTSGKVYVGLWQNKKVAVKKFLVADPPSFRHELTLISLLRHQNLVACYGGFVNESMAMLVTEMMDCTLYEFIHSKRPIDFSYKVRLAQDIAEGMEFLHARGLIHRDLKSVNVLLHVNDFEISAKVCDFGLSRALDTAHKMTGNVGTVAWIAPEVFQNKKYGEKCDVYSFGVILYELLTHSIPFREIPAFRIPGVVVKGQRPTIPSEVLKHAPKEYIQLLHKCWHHNPAKRPSFTEIIAQLALLRPTAPRNSRSMMMVDHFEISIDDDTSSAEEHTSNYLDSLKNDEQALADFNLKWAAKKRQHGKSPLITDPLKLKCLRTRGYHVKSAVDLLSNYLAWYQYLTKGKVITIDMVRKPLEDKLFHVLPGADVDNDPLIFYQCNQHFVEKCPVNEFIKCVLYCLERIIEGPHHKVTIILDTQNWTMKNLSYRNAISFFDTVRKNFPIDVKWFILHNPPSWITKVMGILVPLGGKMIERMKYVHGDQIFQYVPKPFVPRALGGDANFDISAWIRGRYETEQVEYHH
jgi:serine/threonine protein kinase